jgi:hypothetical protein
VGSVSLPDMVPDARSTLSGPPVEADAFGPPERPNSSTHPLTAHEILSNSCLMAGAFATPQLPVRLASPVVDDECTDGGPGAISCDGTYTFAGLSRSCGITCDVDSGYYACCRFTGCNCKSTNDETDDES